MAAGEEFRERQRRTLDGARILAGRLLADDVAEARITVLTGGTEVHLVLVDLRDSALDGRQAGPGPGVEGTPGRGHRRVDLGDACVGDLGQHLAVAGRDHRERGASARLVPAVDVVLSRKVEFLGAAQ